MTDEKMQGNIIKKFLKNIEKMLAFRKNVLYNQTCCDMIALKRRLLYRMIQVFRGANVNKELLTTSHCTNNCLSKG